MRAGGRAGVRACVRACVRAWICVRVVVCGCACVCEGVCVSLGVSANRTCGGGAYNARSTLNMQRFCWHAGSFVFTRVRTSLLIGK